MTRIPTPYPPSAVRLLRRVAARQGRGRARASAHRATRGAHERTAPAPYMHCRPSIDGVEAADDAKALDYTDPGHGCRLSFGLRGSHFPTPVEPTPGASPGFVADGTTPETRMKRGGPRRNRPSVNHSSVGPGAWSGYGNPIFLSRGATEDHRHQIFAHLAGRTAY